MPFMTFMGQARCLPVASTLNQHAVSSQPNNGADYNVKRFCYTSSASPGFGFSEGARSRAAVWFRV